MCDDEALAIFAVSEGCLCRPDDREQALCLHHIMKATPLGSFELKEDFTLNNAFTKWWNNESR
jgi:hypothetical protein